MSAPATPQSGDRPRVGQVQVGDVLEPLSIPVDRPRLVEYAAASGDRNRIHWDQAFATSVGLPDVIAHGMFTMGAAGELVARWAGGPQFVAAFSTRFTRPVVVPYDTGATIDVSGVVTTVDETAAQAVVELTVRVGDETVLGRTLATVSLEGAA